MIETIIISYKFEEMNFLHFVTRRPTFHDFPDQISSFPVIKITDLRFFSCEWNQKKKKRKKSQTVEPFRAANK